MPTTVLVQSLVLVLAAAPIAWIVLWLAHGHHVDVRKAQVAARMSVIYGATEPSAAPASSTARVAPTTSESVDTPVWESVVNQRAEPSIADLPTQLIASVRPRAEHKHAYDQPTEILHAVSDPRTEIVRPVADEVLQVGRNLRLLGPDHPQRRSVRWHREYGESALSALARHSRHESRGRHRLED